MKRLLKALIICLPIVGAIVLLSFFMFKSPWQIEMEAFYRERADMHILESVAQEMISEKAPGVKGEGDDAYIESFAAFCKYLASKRPDVIVDSAGPNPFPSILHGERYETLRGKAGSERDWLIQSRFYSFRGIGEMSSGIRCGGYVNDRSRPIGSTRIVD